MTQARTGGQRLREEIRKAVRKSQRAVAGAIDAWTESVLVEPVGSPEVLPDSWVPDTRTGGVLVTVDRTENIKDVISSLSRSVGVKNVVSGAEWVHEQAQDVDAIVLGRVGVIIVPERQEDPISMDRLCDNLTGVRLEPERFQWATGANPAWVRGYRDGVNAVCDRISAEDASPAGQGPQVSVGFVDGPAASWGLQAIGASRGDATGRGIRVAVLDTGISKDHPSLSARITDTQSFVPVETVDDVRGHGTHCAGTICGDQCDAPFRFGVAPDIELYVGKVLSDSGVGKDRYILAGMEWAIDCGCVIVSMSLGSDVPVPSAAYERMASEGLKTGTLFIAAAGNNADRPYSRGFIGQPANADSILAVAAIDQRLAVALFSSGGTPGTPVTYPDLAAPGVRVVSSWPQPPLFRTCDGTSMACPHAVGAAAVWAEATGDRGHQLRSVLLDSAKRLTDHRCDVGKGVVQVP